MVGNQPEDEELPKVSILRIWKVNQKLWYLLLLGALGAMLNGAVFPVFAIVFGEILEVFAQPSDEVLAGVHLWAGMFLVLGTASALGILLKVYCHCAFVYYELCITFVKNVVFHTFHPHPLPTTLY